jgi:RNA polymerase sigma factor (sigma-70 family)
VYAGAVASDAELYRDWAAGDREAGGVLIDRHLRPVHRFFAAKLSDRTAVDDLVAKTFEVIAAKLGSFRGDGSFRAYVFAIAHNLLRNHLRTLGRAAARFTELETSVGDLDPSPATLMVRDEQKRLLLRALRHIPLDHQVAIELSYVEGLSRSEIAAVLGIPAGTVAGRLRRARQLLEARIAELAANPELRQSTLGSLSEWAREIKAEVEGQGQSGADD